MKKMVLALAIFMWGASLSMVGVSEEDDACRTAHKLCTMSKKKEACDELLRSCYARLSK